MYIVVLFIFSIKIGFSHAYKRSVLNLTGSNS